MRLPTWPWSRSRLGKDSQWPSPSCACPCSRFPLSCATRTAVPQSVCSFAPMPFPDTLLYSNAMKSYAHTLSQGSNTALPRLSYFPVLFTSSSLSLYAATLEPIKTDSPLSFTMIDSGRSLFIISRTGFVFNRMGFIDS